MLTCTLYADEALVRALVEVTSHGNPYAVIDAHPDPTSGAEPPDGPVGLEAARAAVADVERAGGVPLVGLMPVPAAWAGRFGRAPEELFDGCVNLSIATAMLSSFEQACVAGATDRAADIRRRGRAERFGGRGGPDPAIAGARERSGVPLGSPRKVTEALGHTWSFSPEPARGLALADVAGEAPSPVGARQGVEAGSAPGEGPSLTLWTAPGQQRAERGEAGATAGAPGAYPFSPDAGSALDPASHRTGPTSRVAATQIGSLERAEGSRARFMRGVQPSRPGSWTPGGAARRNCVLRRYAEAIEMATLPEVVRLEMSIQATVCSRAGGGVETAALLFGDASIPATRTWGADRLLFAVQTSSVAGSGHNPTMPPGDGNGAKL